MRVLALVRQVLDAEESVKIKDGKVDFANSKLVIDTMDEYGVEEALRLRDAGEVGEVVALAVGPAGAEDVLRWALAMGADRAILVEAAGYLDVMAVSSVVAQVAKTEVANLILLGGQQADWDSQALGAATAERLGWAQVTWTSALQVSGNEMTGQHDVEGGSEAFQVSLPTVVTTQQGLNEPRFRTIPNIRKAKTKELRRDNVEQYGASARLTVLHQEVQAKERGRKILDGSKDADQAAAHLVELLRTETRVIA